jgi:hypothetical protein
LSAVDPLLGTTVATLAMRLRFTQEAASRLVHPNVVSVTDFGSACFLFGHETRRLDVPPTAPVAVRLGCALAENRCTRCRSGASI